MKKLILIGFLLVLWGCKSMPRKNLSTENGVIAAHFNIPENEVESLREKGMDDDSIIKMLIITTGSYLTTDEVLGMADEEMSLEEIALKTGIEQDLLQKKTDKIKQEISKYLSE